MDSNDTSIIEVSHRQLASRGNATPDQLAFQTQTLMEIYRRIMQKDTDYGVIPGTPKPALYQPGAQILRLAAGLEVEMVHIESERQLTIGFINHSFVCRLKNTDGMVVGSCEGSANSYEDRYRYRWLSERDLPQGIDKATLMSKKRRGNYGEYHVYRVENDNPANLDNTLVKMAQKRAFVGAVLMATGASRIFTQDVEDTIDVAEVTPEMEAERPQPAQRKARTKQQVQPPAPEKEQAATGKTEGHVAYSEEPSSITRRSQERVNALLKADETGLTATKVLSRKHWSVKSTAELSEYQAQVIIAVCEGRDESDVMAP